MNLFALSRLAKHAAQRQCDIHVIKMTLETTQILYAVFHLLGHPITTRAHITDANGVAVAYEPYKLTHAHHPCVLWCAAARSHLLWMLEHGFALSEEYTRRYGKDHRCLAHMLNIRNHIKENGTPPAMPHTINDNDYIQWLHQIKVDDNIIERTKRRIATINAPEGTLFGVVAISVKRIDDPNASKQALEDYADKILIQRDINGLIDMTHTYETLYAHKAKYEFPMKWSKHTEPPDQILQNILQCYAPSVTCLTSYPAKIDKSPPITAKQPKKRRLNMHQASKPLVVA
jgi:hypothetical protein